MGGTASFFDNQGTAAEIHQQEAQALRDKQAHSKGWWKRGLGQGILGALPGIVTLNPVMAGAGAAAGFGGEAVNHFGFKDQHPEIAGSAAALASLGSGAASSGLFSAAGKEAGLGGLEHAAAGMGDSDAYASELGKARFAATPGGADAPINLASPAMPGQGSGMSAMSGAHSAGAKPDFMSAGNGATQAGPGAHLANAFGMDPDTYKQYQAWLATQGTGARGV